MEWRNFLWFKSLDISVDICKFRSHWCFMLSSCFSLWHCIFEHCSFLYGSETILFACAAYVEGQRPSGCLPKTTTKWMLDNDQVDACIALPKFARGSMSVQDDDGLSGKLPRSVTLQGDSGSHGWCQTWLLVQGRRRHGEAEWSQRQSLQGPTGSMLCARCLPGTPSIHPRTTGPPLLSWPALLLHAPPTAPPRPPMSPARNVAWPSPMMRAKQPSNCWINGHCRLANPDPGRGKWEGGFLARSMLCNTLCIMLHNI